MEGKHHSCTSSQPHKGPCTAVPLNATHSHLSRTITAPFGQGWGHAVTSTSAAALPTEQQREERGNDAEQCTHRRHSSSKSSRHSSTLRSSQRTPTPPNKKLKHFSPRRSTPPQSPSGVSAPSRHCDGAAERQQETKTTG
ncbi:hypothetical protein DQ04_10911040 [Trypanosoma grayi]|uniref:hypothetical protein n=1 Tax=Trypanosoma grayi TaxID=71804 RepID=UPI0004F447AE|nr:hypothetical protein DQ04_10911040 [Trypanosoma grayi]KEG07103.1 hypothetical protein DQ04_10911040 [Trypanosoma grayi]